MSDYTWEPWSLRDHESAASDDRAIVGFDVQAIDGHIGKVDEANTEVGTSQIVVDTGPWIFGRKVLLPAGCIERIDWAEEQVYVDRTKEQIKSSPELEEGATWSDPTYRDNIAGYWRGTYGSGGSTL